MTILEDDILTIEYNEPIFNSEALELSEPEQFIVDKLNSCVKIVLDDRDIDFIYENGYLSWYNTNNKIFSISYYYIWSFLKNKYGYNEEQIKELTTNILLKVFIFEVMTTKHP